MLELQGLSYASRVKTAVAALLLLASCAPNEPPSWPQGGAHLALADARWDRADGSSSVELRANGEVLDDGSLLFILDRVGRIVDPDYDPAGILLPDGLVRGTNNHPLGRVGVTNAAPPWSGTAWLSVQPDGSVTFFSEDGDREPGGRFYGCHGPILRTCTLVAHLVTMRRARPAERRAPVQFGVGMGVGM